jgi:hypothetical protein
MTGSALSHRWCAPLLTMAVLALACEPAPTAPLADAPLAAKAPRSTDPTVTSVEPSYGRQDQTLHGVKINGSGFDRSAVATWELGGSPAAGITVLATRYIKSTQLEADVAIAADAELSLYDVAVTLTSAGKRGVGLEKFEVTIAQVVDGTCTSDSAARSVSDAGAIVGADCTNAFYFEAGVLQILGSGVATDINAEGTAIVGASWSAATATKDGPALVWTRNGTQWVAQELPSNGLSARANAVASDANGAASLIAGYVKEQVNRKTIINRPTLWTRDGAGWKRVTLPLPAGFSSNDVRARDVTAAGHVAAGPVPIVWDPLPGGGHAGTVLPGSNTELRGISPDGNMVVGDWNGVAAYWTRLTGSSWSGPHALTACPGGAAQTYAYAVDAEGLVVGRGCNGATMWRVTGDGVRETRLSGLSVDETSQVAIAVSPSRIAGRVLNRAVYWSRF